MTDILSLLNDQDKIAELFYNHELHFSNSFFIIDPKTKEYDTLWKEKFNHPIQWMQHLLQSYREGKTIIIKNLEKHIDLTEEFGHGIDIHAYIVPRTLDNTGDSFDWHTDDRTVWAKVLWGTKMFCLRNVANETTMENYIKLNSNQKIYIRKGQWHKAIPMGPSCLLSIGLPDSNLKDA